VAPAGGLIRSEDRRLDRDRSLRWGARNSQPPCEAQKPFGMWATMIATTRSPATMPGPIGPPRPRIVNTPPPASARITTQAQNRPRRMPMLVSHPACQPASRPCRPPELHRAVREHDHTDCDTRDKQREVPVHGSPPNAGEQLPRDMRSDAYDLSVSSVVVSAPPRSILRLLALGQGSVEIDEKTDEDVSAVVLRPGVGGANQRVQRYPLRLVRAGKLEFECSVQLPVSRLPELLVERMRCHPSHCDPSAR
jgi:hypothetical protein